MVHLSSKFQQAIVQKVLPRDYSSSMKQLAKTHNIGYSTLQPWVKDYRTGNGLCFLTHKMNRSMW